MEKELKLAAKCVLLDKVRQELIFSFFVKSSFNLAFVPSTNAANVRKLEKKDKFQCLTIVSQVPITVEEEIVKSRKKDNMSLQIESLLNEGTLTF